MNIAKRGSQYLGELFLKIDCWEVAAAANCTPKLLYLTETHRNPTFSSIDILQSMPISTGRDMSNMGLLFLLKSLLATVGASVQAIDYIEI